MSVIFFLQTHKVQTLKILMVIFAIGIGILGTSYLKNRPTDKPDVLGQATTTDSQQTSDEFIPLNEIKDKVGDLVQNYIDQTKKVIDTAEFQTTKFIEQTASKSAEAVQHTIIQNTVGPLIKQIEKLPVKEQEELKKNICK